MILIFQRRTFMRVRTRALINFRTLNHGSFISTCADPKKNINKIRKKKTVSKIPHEYKGPAPCYASIQLADFFNNHIQLNYTSNKES